MVDPKVWRKIDSGRSLASGNNEEMLDMMLEQRARDTMKRLEAMHKGEDKEDEGDQVEVSDGDDEYHGTKGNKSSRRPKRKRTCVVSDSDEEYCEEHSVDDCEEDLEAWTSADEDDMESDWDDCDDYKTCKKKKPLPKQKRKPGGEQDDGTKRLTRAATKKLQVSQGAQGGDVPSSSGDTRGRLRRIQPSRTVKTKVVVVLEEEADKEPDKAEVEAGTDPAQEEVAAETEVEESDEEDVIEEEDGRVEEAGPVEEAGGADVRGDGGADAGADTGAGGGVDAEVDGGADSELATQRVEMPARRRPPESVSGMVGKMRAAGSLPNRRDVLMQVMQLQLTLEREERAQESLICTNAILTLQELMQQVERLRHTY